MNQVKIFVVTHKNFMLPPNLDSCYLPMQVGTGNNIANYLRENNIGSDNIANKNANYCELTVLYYIWKNIQSDIVGLVHYRRYFTKKHTLTGYTKNKLTSLFTTNSKKMSDKYYIISQKDIDNILLDHDLIVPTPYKLDRITVYEDYIKTHYKKDWQEAQKIISEKYPEYQSVFTQVANSDQFIACNALIGKKQVVSDYCEWLFDILFTLEKRIDLSEYDDYNKRVFGFLSERLFTVWLNYNREKYKVYYLDLTFYNT